ncbi:response regulator receiver protein [Magnetococcus marinus MC-1]|uniref:Response regulator receiver protein n=1 Tax=Magnetococcus marinus (strain ATCC BAA-1437 / JCM 17883 / MC-1) TaxID=156889 RepID=A0LAE9_MAGMM|nr:response regulator [Magnetococcus marinus]ABK44942.1 response regulator receiver protein [Magnetococcus marinus MC-1]
MQRKILVVDDSAAARQRMQQLLEAEYILEFADDGVGAIEQVEQFKPDLILLDRMMPTMDGMETCRHLKAHQIHKHLPVIFVTSLSTPAHIAEGIAAGAYYYITKPFDVQILTTVIKSAFSHVRAYTALNQEMARVVHVMRKVTKIDLTFKTIAEACDIALVLSHICPQPSEASIGLTELLINAVEHGNLALSYADKKQLLLAGTYHLEIEQRLTDKAFAHKQGRVRMASTPKQIQIIVQDQGTGFDWTPYLEFNPDRAFDPNGRGIALANKNCFSHLEYRGCGNEVVAKIYK